MPHFAPVAPDLCPSYLCCSEFESEPVTRAAWALKASSFESIELNNEMKNNSPPGEMKSTAAISVVLFCFSRSELSV